MTSLLDGVPRPLRVAAGASACVILLILGAWLALEVVSRLLLILLPIIIALLLTSVLSWPNARLRRVGVPPGLAAAIVLLGALAIFVGVIALLTPVAVDDASSLDLRVTEGLEDVTGWLESRFGMEAGELDRRIQDARGSISGSALTGPLTRGVFMAIEIVAGALLALVLVFFFLRDGERMWGWFVHTLSAPHRVVVDRAGRRAWATLRSYAGGIVLIAALNALMIGVALWLIGVPLVLPLTLLTFVAAFVPIVGAVSAGFAAAMVALAAEGPMSALLVIGAAIVVEQIESNVWEPLIMSRAVELHPVVILVAVATGGILLGLVGAFLAVPAVAVTWQAFRGVRGLPDNAGRRPLRIRPPTPWPRRPAGGYTLPGASASRKARWPAR